MRGLEPTTDQLPYDYDPQKGLEKIADAKRGEEQCRRARDAENLLKEIATKIQEQAKYTVWRDAAMMAAKKAGHGPGRGKKGSRVGAVSFSVALPEADPGQDTADRWRKSFCIKSKTTGTRIDPEKVKTAIDDARLRCVRICEQHNAGTVRGTEGTGEFERYTPARYIELVRKVLGAIDLDPATSEQAQKTVQATSFFVEAQNGLEREWNGRVFLNPPYHRELAPKFINKLVAEHAAGRVTAAIVLTNNSSDTDWFDAAERASTGICFTHGRIRFTVPNGDEVLPTQGQTFFYLGDDVQRFEDVFWVIGFCVKPSRHYGEEPDIEAADA
jgi:hypothetical protein